MNIRGVILFLSSFFLVSVSLAQRTTTTGGNTLIDTILSGIMSAFNQNPVYAIIAIVIGLPIGWFVHQMMFGY